jgi:Transposase DDE domain
MIIEERLIHVYLFVCDHFPALSPMIERYSNNNRPAFTDQEVLTIYLFGIIERRFTVKLLHKYIEEHWLSWFPLLPGYEAYNHRLGVLSPLLPALLEICEHYLSWSTIMPDVYMIDSMPIILARSSRSDGARVAREVADKGYCPSKNLWYHGIKLHAIVAKGHHCLPRLFACELSSASEHDVQSLRRQIDELTHADVYGDRAYFYHDLDEQCAKEQTTIWAVKPRVKGQPILPTDERLRNTSISRMRQPIESWFNWLQQKTAIESASKVRSTKGLIIHTLGRMAAALIALIFNF